MKTVYLVTYGDGDDGNEWGVISIHSTRERAEISKQHYERPRKRTDGSTYNHDADIEEWDFDMEMERIHPEDYQCPNAPEGYEHRYVYFVGIVGGKCCYCGKEEDI
jgi:hypothetical protein